MPRPFCETVHYLHRSVFEKLPSTFDEFPLTRVLQIKSSSLPGKKMYLHTMRLFSFNVADDRRVLAVRAKARAQCVVRAVAKHLALGEE